MILDLNHLLDNYRADEIYEHDKTGVYMAPHVSVWCCRSPVC